jgi:hypothetical protein
VDVEELVENILVADGTVHKLENDILAVSRKAVSVLVVDESLVFENIHATSFDDTVEVVGEVTYVVLRDSRFTARLGEFHLVSFEHCRFCLMMK